MIVLRAYKTELDLNNKQATLCAKHAGTARFAYNWGLARRNQAYQAGQKVPTAIDLHKELNALKKTDFPWMYEVSKCAPQEALRNLDKSFDNFFRRLKLKKAGQLKGKVGFPKFKSKKCGLGSFRLTGKISVRENKIKLPRLGWLRYYEKGYIPTDNIKILSVTVSEKARHWFVSVQVEWRVKPPASVEQEISIEKATGSPSGESGCTTAFIGVDLGIKNMAVCSDGNYFENPKALRKAERKMKQAQRELSRRQKGGKNREKSRRKVARLHYRISNIRSDAIHKATTSIVAKNKPVEQRPSVVVIEDLLVSGMLKNHKLAKAIADVGFGEFRRQLNYKTVWNGVSLLIAPRFFPSSKLCSACGAINDNLTLADRTWTCDCGARGENVRLRLTSAQFSVKREPNAN